MNSPMPLQPPISDAVAFLLTARSYRIGSHAILTNGDVRNEQETDRRFVLPTVMLIAHAIEVYLKAWLSNTGVSTDDLKRGFGHKLKPLFEEAKIRGLSDPPRQTPYTFKDLVESFEKQHSDYSFRYPTDGWTYDVPQMDLVFSLLNELDAQIGVAVLGNPEPMVLGPDNNMRLPPDQS